MTKTDLIVEPEKQEFLITREFNASRELVFKAFTDPKLYAQWIGPRGLKATIETFEPRNGGSWRYVQRDQNGNEFAFHLAQDWRSERAQLLDFNNYRAF